MPKLPHNQRGQRQHQVQQQTPPRVEVRGVQVREQWSGPIPPPEALERFNQIIPDGANRIVAMAEKEQTHRIEYEKEGLTATVKETKRGQILGAIISIVAVLGAIYTASIGSHWIVSMVLVGIPVLGIVRAITKPGSK